MIVSSQRPCRKLFGGCGDKLVVMSYHQRIEAPELANFLTTRSRESRLWFVNNRALEGAILGYAAKYAARYSVKLYGLALEGNHIQGPALFPKGNRASFMRDLNSSVARAVPRYTNHPGGGFWARRYSNEFLPGNEDIEEYFFYTALQPIQDGLVEKISDYPGYNCFHDAIWGRKLKFKVIRWGEFNAARRRNPSVSISDFTDIVSLQYERLPGYEELSQKDYAHLMLKKLEERRTAIVAKRKSKGLGFAGKDNLKKTIPGALPQSTKISTPQSHRPRVLSVCPKRRAECKAWYFDIYFNYKESSREYRSGNFEVVFPLGTYPPYLPCAHREQIAA